MSLKVDIAFTLNGAPAALAVPAEASVLEVLRRQLDLAGAKLVCDEGEWYAFTIIVDGMVVNS